MSAYIPAPFLNMRVHAGINMGLGALSFIFQIAALAESPSNYYELIGIGFWGGLILLLTAMVAYRTSPGDSPFMLGCNFVLSIISLILSFTIVGVFSASLDFMHRYPNVCNGFALQNGTEFIPIEIGKLNISSGSYDVVECGSYTVARQSFDALLLIFGLIGIPVNGLLVLSTISSYNPPAAS